jgi:hypothetical protein
VPLAVHGIVAADDAARLDVQAFAEEVGTESRLITHGEAAALVSQVPDEEVLPTRANLLAHTKLLEAVVQQASVLPMRFGVVAPDEETLVATTLEPRQAELHDALGRLAGHVEMRLVGRYQEGPAVARVLASDRRAARLRDRQDLDAKMELGERIVAGIAEQREVDTARAVEALRPYAADVTAGEVGQPLDAFALSFLIPPDGRAAFESAVDELAAELGGGVELELIGPLPPFSFAGTGGA